MPDPLIVLPADTDRDPLEGVFRDPPGSALAELRRTNQAARRQA